MSKCKLGYNLRRLNFRTRRSNWDKAMTSKYEIETAL